MENRLNFDIHHGTNMWAGDPNKKGASPEFDALVKFLANVLHGTGSLAMKCDIPLTCLPSIYLNCFVEIFPVVIETIMKDSQKEEAKNYLDQHLNMLKGMVKNLQENKKSKP